MKVISIIISMLALTSSNNVFAKEVEAPAVKAETGVFGYWQTLKSPQDKDNVVGYIHIKPCNNNPNKVCGYVVGGEKPIDPETGKEWLDKLNPEESLRTRPVKCLQIMSDFVPSGTPKSYAEGTIYSSATGETYSCSLELKDQNHLAVTGSALLGLASETEIWTRMNPAPKDPCK